MEGVLAAFAQFDNDCRSDRTRAGMKAALELGRWVFLAPLGYLPMRRSLMPDPERAPIVRRLFKRSATGTYTKQDILQKATSFTLGDVRANSTPDPDFRYFSNFSARVSSANLTRTSTAHGRCFDVCEQRPAL